MLAYNVQRGETEMQIIVDFCYMTDYMLLTLENVIGKCDKKKTFMCDKIEGVRNGL